MESTVALKELCVIPITDGTHQTPVYADEGYIFLSSKNVTSGEIDWDNTMFIPKELHVDLYKRIAPQRDDILLAKNGTTGVAAIVDRDIVFDIYVSLALIRPDKSKVIPKYLLYAINNETTKRYFDSHLKGIGVPNLHLTHIRETPIRVPSFRRQQNIVNEMVCIDQLISLRKQQIAKLDELVKSRFVEMFGDPEFNPLGWVKAPLGDVITNANNGMARRGNDAEGSIVMRLVELQDGYIDYSAPNRIILNDVEKRRYLLRNNDFLFARVNGNPENVGRCAVFFDIGEPVYHNDHIIRVHFDEALIDGAFASALFNSAYGKRQMSSQIKTSAGQYTISQDGIGAIITILPPLSLQKRFAAFAEQTDKSKLTIQHSLAKLETLKKSLMQKYFGQGDSE